MRFAVWFARIVRDIGWYGVANRDLAVSIAILGLLAIGLLVIGAQASAPFIYALF